MKNRVEELAIFGGAPAFAEKLHVGRPNVGDRSRLISRINDLLDLRWLSNNGPLVQELEQRIADLLGVKHCIAMCNGTIALEIAIRALGLSGEVILPSFTFIATAHAIQWQAMKPVFCDIDKATHTIDPKQLERLITPRTTGVIAVHTWGQPCDVEALAEVCGRRSLKLVFDAAHAFHCSHQGRMIGGFGNAEVFSFHATKFFNTFEGGAVTTNDDELAAKIRLMKNFGFAGYDNVVCLGTNGKMSEVSAAMGLTSLESLEEFVNANRRNYELYRDLLKDIPGIRMFLFDESEQCNYQYVVLEVDADSISINRDDLIRILWAENVIARRYFYPGCHRMEPYRAYYPHAGSFLKHTEALAARVLVLPNGTTIQAKDVREVCDILKLAIDNGDKLRGMMSNEATIASAQAHQTCQAR